MLSHVSMYDQIWDYYEDDDNHQTEHYYLVKRTTGNPETIAVGDTWSEFVHSNGTIALQMMITRMTMMGMMIIADMTTITTMGTMTMTMRDMMIADMTERKHGRSGKTTLTV